MEMDHCHCHWMFDLIWPGLAGASHSSLPHRVRAASSPTLMLPAALLSRSLLARHLLSAALPQVDPAPVRKLKFSCTTTTTPALHPGTLRGTHGIPLVDPTRPAQVDGSSSTRIPQGGLGVHRICVLAPGSWLRPRARTRLQIQAWLYDPVCVRNVCTGSSHPLASHSFTPSLLPFPVPSLPPFLFVADIYSWCCESNVALHMSKSGVDSRRAPRL
ncbi:hypothetical protein B0H14DRAFT_3895932 [Mycena olivaceomarginata]|nr:hypothetical protein B0H14DRAFT_3895932 [Mycena olivaceomarginata]